MSAEVKNHPFHIVDPSPWPFVGAFGAISLAIGGIMYMHGASIFTTLPGFAIILYTFYVWGRDIVREANAGSEHTPQVRHGLRMGMVLFIASEVMFFFAWFWAFFNAAIYPTEQMGFLWPPEGVTIFNPWGIPFLNTIILLSSGVTVTWAHHALKKNDRKGLIMGLWVTVALGAIFTAFQAYEYMNAPFSITGGIYGTTFFMATGFHGAHVIIGTVFLAVCLFRSYKGHFTPDHHFGFEAAAWYWHFVDVVWLFLFTFVYWWTASGAASVH